MFRRYSGNIPRTRVREGSYDVTSSWRWCHGSDELPGTTMGLLKKKNAEEGLMVDNWEHIWFKCMQWDIPGTFCIMRFEEMYFKGYLLMHLFEFKCTFKMLVPTRCLFVKKYYPTLLKYSEKNCTIKWNSN